MTLTQLSAFVLVARLGSVRAAAEALGVSEPAVSQAIASLRKHFGDELVFRSPPGMALTPGGQRLVGIASQMVSLGADAEAAVRAANGAAEQLRIVADGVVAEYMLPGLVESFEKRYGAVEATVGVVSTEQMPALVRERLADVGVSFSVPPPGTPALENMAVMRCEVIAVASRSMEPAARRSWLVGPCYGDERSPLRRALDHSETKAAEISVFPSQAAAIAAASRGEGVAPVIDRVVSKELSAGSLVLFGMEGLPRRTYLNAMTLPPPWCSPAAASFRRFLATPQAMQLLSRPRGHQPPGRFRPPVFVTLWN